MGILKTIKELVTYTFSDKDTEQEVIDIYSESFKNIYDDFYTTKYTETKIRCCPNCGTTSLTKQKTKKGPPLAQGAFHCTNCDVTSYIIFTDTPRI